MGPAEIHRRTGDWFGTLVHGVDSSSWDAPTPCTDWNVRELVNHVAAEELWMPPLLEGATIAEVGDRFDGDVLGEDPVAAWDEAWSLAATAAAAPGAADGRVHLSYGEEWAAEYVRQVACDQLIHGWDLAVATGQVGEPPAELVDEVAAWFDAGREEAYRGAGAVADAATVPGDAGPWESLLARFGRDPGWRAAR